MDVPSCCCADWVAGLARDHASRLAAVARREGLAPADALDAVQDALHALIARDDAAALRDRPDDAARVLVAIVKNAARNARRRHHRAKPHLDVELASTEPGPMPRSLRPRPTHSSSAAWPGSPSCTAAS